MKIGITERGDAGLNLSWEKKLGTVDGAILITKNLNDAFIKAAIRNQEKLIIHVTMTGYGGTSLEPNVPTFEWTNTQIEKLFERGFDPARVVVRIDPIIPTAKGLEVFERVYLSVSCRVSRIRISVLDMYPHVRERFTSARLPLPYDNKFSASAAQFASLDEMLLRYGDSQFEACAEPRLKNVSHCGCISEKDLILLGIYTEDTAPGGYQRKGCLCLGCKVELLERKEQCPHNCLYCYWK